MSLEGGIFIKRNNNEKASISILKVSIISLILIFALGIGVRAVNTEISSVKVVLSNNYELNILTNKTNVKEILEDNHIIVLEDEKVVPGLEEQISQNKTIVITNKASKTTDIIKLAEENKEVSMEQIISNYTTITEKIITEQVAIPFETITKDVSNSEETTNRVIQQGKEGLKQITYKAKFQNDVEIERIVLSEEILKEPVNKIIQIKSKTTSRNSDSSRTATENVTGTTLSTKYKITAYCACMKCCGKTNGITASGKKAQPNHTIAAPSNFPMGTKLKINGTVYTVEDRGGAIKGNRIDIYVNSHAEALKWGVKYLNVEVLN